MYKTLRIIFTVLAVPLSTAKQAISSGDGKGENK